MRMRKNLLSENVANGMEKLTVDTKGLQAMTDSGYTTAVKIGIAAGARIKVGKSVRWNVSKVRKYLDAISE